MSGIEIIISTICTAGICEVPYDVTDKEIYPTLPQSENGEFYKKMVDDINGKHLKIATYNNRPLSFIESQNGTLVADGVAFVILDMLRKRFNFTFEIVQPNRNYEFGGRDAEDSLIGLVSSNKVDMVAAFLPTLIKYRQKASFSIELDEGTWVMMLKRPTESATGAGLLAPFNQLVWFFVLAAVVTFGPCITFFTRVRSKLIADGEMVLELKPSVWFVYSAFLKQGTSLAPEANTTRVLFVTWWLFMILLSAFYTANLTAFLTLSKFTLAIEYPKDLYKKNYRWIAVAGSAVEHTVKTEGDDLYYLNAMVRSGRATFISVKDDKDLLSHVSKGAVLVKEVSVVDYLMYKDYISKKDVKESDRCTYVVAPNAFMTQQRAFAYPIGSTLKPLFDPILERIRQSGIVQFLKTIDVPKTKICPLDLQSKDRKLRNSDLIMTYMVMGTGSGTAVAVFLAEIILRRYVTVKVSKQNKTKVTKVKPKKKSQLYDDSRPPPYESLFGKNPKFNLENTKTKMINGREYYVFYTSGGNRKLIPARAPSSLLYRSDK